MSTSASTTHKHQPGQCGGGGARKERRRAPALGELMTLRGNSLPARAHTPELSRRQGPSDAQPRPLLTQAFGVSEARANPVN